MFRKEFKVKTNVKSKNSEKRKLISDISNYYRIDQSILTNLIGKVDLFKIKVECCDDTIITIYNFDEQPLFFELNKVIIPTVYLLWSVFDILPSFTIHEQTVNFIMNGSDLMIPGIIVNKPLNEKSYGIFNKRELHTINTNTNRAPVAIGLTNFDNYDMFMTGGRGKALNVIHVQGDSLWAFGKKNLRPQNNYDSELLIDSENDENESTGIESENELIEESEDIDDIVQSLEDISFSTLNNNKINMDELLETCFIHALKCSLKDKNLPINLNTFYANHVLRFCPEVSTIEIKKTSFKKFGVFMKLMELDGIITLKSIGKGVDVINAVNRSHEKLKFTPTLIFNEENKNKTTDEYVFPQIEEIFFVTDKIHNLLRFYGYKKSDIISPKDIKSIITEYVNKNNLNGLNKEMVSLDDVLKGCCLNSKEKLGALSWKTLFERVQKNMTPGLVMRFPNESVTVKNTKKPKIKIQSFKRNNKMVTRVEGEILFSIDSKKLCLSIQQSIGCSCGMVSDKTGVMAIQAQGDHIERITEILMDKYKVPMIFIDGGVSKKSK